MLTRSSFKTIMLRGLKLSGGIDANVYNILGDFSIIKEAKTLEESGAEKYVHAFDYIFNKLEREYDMFYHKIYDDYYKLYRELVFKEFGENIMKSKEYISVLERYKLDTSCLDLILDKIHSTFINENENNISYLLLKKIISVSGDVTYGNLISCFGELAIIERKHLNKCAYYE